MSCDSNYRGMIPNFGDNKTPRLIRRDRPNHHPSYSFLNGKLYVDGKEATQGRTNSGLEKESTEG